MALNDVKEIQIPNPVLKPIPSGYRQYEYLNRNPSNNNPHIDLGIKATSNTNIECEFSYNDSTGAAGNYNKIIFGSGYFDEDVYRITDGIVLFTYISSNSTAITSLGFRYGDGNYPKFDYDQFTSGTKYKFKNEGGNVYINDVLNSNLSNTSGSFSHKLGNILIGAAGTGTVGYNISASNFNLYSFKVYENNVLVKDLVPVVETATSIAGLYDLVNNEFLSPTTGTFTAVNRLDLTVDVKQIQDSNNNIIWGSWTYYPYRRLEYIHFSGVDEYFDIGYKPNNTTQFTMNLKIITNAYNGKGYMGVRNRYGIGSDQNNWFFGLGNWVSTSITAVDGNFHTASIRPNGFSTNVGYKIDNNNWVNPGNVSFVNGGTGNIYIGCHNSDQGPTTYFQQDVKSIQLIENTTTVRNMIPCQRKSDSVCGMYDTINNVFYPLTGTTITSGAAGPTVDEYWNLTA